MVLKDRPRERDVRELFADQHVELRGKSDGALQREDLNGASYWHQNPGNADFLSFAKNEVGTLPQSLDKFEEEWEDIPA